ncbi:MAG: ABC transporter substrate-binding protein [Pseudomonadota bacterium]|nr:ABC transporter substrate-binding protein [Pseudomonadota bacterium]
MFQNLNKYLIGSLLLLVIFVSSANGREYCDEAIAFINEVTDETLSIINSSEFTKNQKKSNLSELLNKNADFETMGKVMLGKYARKLPDDMKEVYTDLIQKMLTKTIYDRLDNDEEEPDVTYGIVNDSCRTKGSKNREFLVDGDVLKNDSKLASIRWWIIINKDQQYKVIDLTLAGVSLTLQKKDEFTSYLSNKSVSQLINNLSKKFD